MATVANFTRNGLPPRTHAYDDPDLSAIEFLQAVYRDPRLPMSTRIDAARGLLPFTEPRPASIPSSHVGCTIVIGGLGPSPEALDRITENHSENHLSARKTLSHGDEAGDPQNTETTSHPLPFKPFLSTPGPSFIDHTEFLQSKTIINKLNPDLIPHLLPDQLHYCSCCDVWIAWKCPHTCPHDPSKLN